MALEPERSRRGSKGVRDHGRGSESVGLTAGPLYSKIVIGQVRSPAIRENENGLPMRKTLLDKVLQYNFARDRHL